MLPAAQTAPTAIDHDGSNACVGMIGGGIGDQSKGATYAECDWCHCVAYPLL